GTSRPPRAKGGTRAVLPFGDGVGPAPTGPVTPTPPFGDGLECGVLTSLWITDNIQTGVEPPLQRNCAPGAPAALVSDVRPGGSLIPGWSIDAGRVPSPGGGSAFSPRRRRMISCHASSLPPPINPFGDGSPGTHGAPSTVGKPFGNGGQA